MENDIEFNEFLNDFNMLENKIKTLLSPQNINPILKKYDELHVENIDTLYNKLVVYKITENLFTKKIINLLK